MKKRILLFSFVLAGIAALSLAAQAEVQGLRNEGADLRAQLQALQQRMKKLEGTVDKIQQPPHPMPLSGPSEKLLVPKIKADSGEPPQIWGEREVNGWTFYVVPCGQQGH